MSRILGIDYGTRKIGFALSDEDQKIAFPKDVQENIFDMVAEHIGNIILHEDVTEVVVGLPRNFDGTDNELTKEVREFADRLKDYFRLPMHFEDESFTSKAVESSNAAPYRKTDASAAALILQSFLDRRNKKEENKDY